MNVDRKQLEPISSGDRSLSLEESQYLHQCESVIAEGLADFIRVGEALLAIATQGLYRATHASFEVYCRDRWGLARRTAYQKIEAAKTYATVRNCAQFPPQNEYQALQLAKLPTEALQQAAWQQVVTNANGAKRAITARVIRDVVRTVAPQRMADHLPERLQPARIFPGIPWTWRIGSLSKDTDSNKVRLKLPTLPPIAHANDVTHDTEVQRVLVSPDIDIFHWNLPEAYPGKLAAVMESFPQYRFLVWTKRPARFPALPWSANVDLVVRVSSQDDLDRLMHSTSEISQIQTLWICATAPLTLSPALPFRRVLINNVGVGVAKADGHAIALRQCVGQLLSQSIAVHLDTSLHEMLYENAL